MAAACGHFQPATGQPADFSIGASSKLLKLPVKFNIFYTKIFHSSNDRRH
jgi:hypothetical protein